MDRSVTQASRFMVALDARTGRERWRQTGRHNPDGARPSPIRVATTTSSSSAAAAGSRPSTPQPEPCCGTAPAQRWRDPDAGGRSTAWYNLRSAGQARPLLAGRVGVTSRRRTSSGARPKGSSFVAGRRSCWDYLYTGERHGRDRVEATTRRRAELAGQLRLRRSEARGFRVPVGCGGTSSSP